VGLEISAVERLGDTSATKERQKMAVWGTTFLHLITGYIMGMDVNGRRQCVNPFLACFVFGVLC
jgi:hypothetical protein